MSLLRARWGSDSGVIPVTMFTPTLTVPLFGRWYIISRDFWERESVLKFKRQTDKYEEELRGENE